MLNRARVGLMALLLCGTAQAEQVRVAVAANFAPALKALAAGFEQGSGHQLLASAGATGKLYAQIKSGAPFDILLAADQTTPAKLEQEGDAVAQSRFTYASGKLLLWSPQPGLVDERGRVLFTGTFRHIALAAPQLAPYGAAAVQTLTALGLHKTLEPRWVQGESIGQTYGFVATGHAELGFIALSQVAQDGRIGRGSGWLVPPALYQPLRQDAVLLARSSQNAGALALLAYLKTQQAQTVIRSFGYETP